MPLLLLSLSIPALFSGCETTDKMLGAAERAVGSSTGRTVLDIVGGKDPAEIARRRVENYGRDPQALLRDLRSIQRDFQALMAALTEEVGKKWGTKEVKLPEQKKYVKYTQNYRSRAIVDFDAGNILIETLDEKDPRASLKNAVVTTLLTPNDPRSVDLFTDKEITLTSEKEPYLLGLVLDQSGKPVRTPAEAEQFADTLLSKNLASRKVEQEEGRKPPTWSTSRWSRISRTNRPRNTARSSDSLRSATRSVPALSLPLSAPRVTSIPSPSVLRRLTD
jgi:membrane-bound lytic murein transglycosylase C